MDLRQFEQAVLHMVYAGGQRRLTSQSVGYQLGMSAKAAEAMLDTLASEGTLDLDSDDEGNIFYFIPGSGSGALFGTTPPQPEQWPQPHQPPSAGAPQQSAWGQPPAGYPSSNQPPPGPQTWGPHTGATPHAPPNQQSQWGPAPQGQASPWAQAQSPGAAHQPGGPYGQAGAQQWQQPPHAGGHHHPQPWPGQQLPVPGTNPYASNNYQASVGMGGQGYANRTAMVHTRRPADRDPVTAGMLSIVPGAGQLYAGQFGKAFFFFLSTMFLYGVVSPLAIVLHGMSSLDAVRTVVREKSTKALPR